MIKFNFKLYLGFLAMVVSVMTAMPVTVQAATFEGLGDLPGGQFVSRGRAVSGDGAVVVGGSSAGSGGAFRWTSSGGMVNLGQLGDAPGVGGGSDALGASSNGSVVAGTTETDGGLRAFRWTSTGGMVSIGDLPGGLSDSRGAGISGDGSVVVGRSVSALSIPDATTRYEAFRWTNSGGMVGLGDLPGGVFDSYANAVSGDGLVVVGQSVSASSSVNNNYEAFRWTSSGGMVGLGDLAGGSFGSSATGASDDGAVVVGFSNVLGGRVPFRWTNSTGMVSLGSLPGGSTNSRAWGVSGDGNIIVGEFVASGDAQPFIWDATNGARDLQAVLMNDYGLGATLTGWDLERARAISSDGLTIVGEGFNPSGDLEAFRVGLGPVSPSNNPPTAHIAPISPPHPGEEVTLDGTGSSDSDVGDTLSFAWSVIGPDTNPVPVTNSDQPMGSFTPTMLGDYIVELIVTDSQSATDTATLTINSFNTAPTADAGEDQAITLINTTIALDGCSSYDMDGDAITFQWTLISPPVGSTATLSDMASCDPTFIADINGSYQASLIVTDIFGAMSAPDSVTMSFNNIKPVAEAGGNQIVIVSEQVDLDGSSSHDGNNDPLTFQWSLTTQPAGSTATLNDGTVVNPYFTADAEGVFVGSLVVNDGMMNSDPDTVTITAISVPTTVIHILDDVVDIINALDPNSDLKNKNLQSPLTNKIAAVIQFISDGQFQEAIDKLENDVIGKTDGCAVSGNFDKNDWLTNCGAQVQVYPKLIDAIDLLEELL